MSDQLRAAPSRNRRRFFENCGPETVETLGARMYLSEAFLIQHKYAEAIKETTLIYPMLVNKLGADHQATLTVLGTRAASEGSLGLWDQAIRDDLAVYKLAVRKRGAASLYSTGALSDVALSQCSAGRYAEGESNARKALQESREAFGPRAGLTGACSYALATCLIGRNKLREASSLLRNIDARAVSELSGDSAVAASIALAQGEIASRRGDYLLARQYVETAAPAFERPDADRASKQTLARVRKAIESSASK